MKRILFLLLCAICLTACVKDIERVEYDVTITNLKGGWVQQGISDGTRHYMEFTDTNMKLYSYGDKKNAVYLINSQYSIIGDSIVAKDYKTGKTKSYYFNMPYCTLLIFDEFKLGFIKDK